MSHHHNTSGVGHHSNDWQLYFQGGGWCYSDVDCWGRSKTTLGSSLHWTPTIGKQAGIISSDCTENPDFCQFNRVYMVYGRVLCDNSAVALAPPTLQCPLKCGHTLLSLTNSMLKPAVRMMTSHCVLFPQGTVTEIPFQATETKDSRCRAWTTKQCLSTTGAGGTLTPPSQPW